MHPTKSKEEAHPEVAWSSRCGTAQSRRIFLNIVMIEFTLLYRMVLAHNSFPCDSAVPLPRG
jgi:hypothetical protein